MVCQDDFLRRREYPPRFFGMRRRSARGVCTCFACAFSTPAELLGERPAQETPDGLLEFARSLKLREMRSLLYSHYPAVWQSRRQAVTGFSREDAFLADHEQTGALNCVKSRMEFPISQARPKSVSGRGQVLGNHLR